jgi:hypothetical protein
VFRTNVAKVDHDVAYVAIIVHVCCNLQVSIPNVSSVFSDVCCKCVYFASVLSGCCICLQLFVIKCFSYVFICVSDTYFKYFSCVSYVCYNCFVWMFCFKAEVLRQGAGVRRTSNR